MIPESLLPHIGWCQFRSVVSFGYNHVDLCGNRVHTCVWADIRSNLGNWKRQSAADTRWSTESFVSKIFYAKTPSLCRSCRQKSSYRETFGNWRIYCLLHWMVLYIVFTLHNLHRHNIYVGGHRTTFSHFYVQFDNYYNYHTVHAVLYVADSEKDVLVWLVPSLVLLFPFCVCVFFKLMKLYGLCEWLTD
jgi:hypothetical protein